MYDEYMYNTAAEPTLSVTKTIPARKWGPEVHCLVAASGGEQVAQLATHTIPERFANMNRNSESPTGT